MDAFAQLHITGNVTPSLALAAGSAFPAMTESSAVARHGDASFTIDAATAKVTAKVAQRVRVSLRASFETEDISGTSGDGVGNVGVCLLKNGVIVTGTKCPVNQAAIDLIKQATIAGFLIDLAATDYVQAGVFGEDASGNDVTIREAGFTVERAD